MYCSHCGKQIENESLACPYCGMPTSRYERQTERAAQQHLQKADVKSNADKAPISVIVGLVAFGLCCMGFMIAQFMNSILERTIVDGVFSIPVAALSITSFIFMFKEGIKKPCRIIFPTCMFMICVVYLIAFLCDLALV